MPSPLDETSFVLHSIVSVSTYSVRASLPKARQNQQGNGENGKKDIRCCLQESLTAGEEVNEIAEYSRQLKHLLRPTECGSARTLGITYIVVLVGIISFPKQKAGGRPRI